MTRTIALAMQKGGSGKTTTCLNLGAALAERSRRVLLVDMDPQANLTQYLGHEPHELKETIYTRLKEFIAEGTGNAPPVLNTDEGVDLVPSNLQLSLGEFDLVNAFRREHALSQVLAPITAKYDYVLIDCPPSLGILVANALTAAESVVVPVQAEFFAASGVSTLMHLIHRLRRIGLNPDLRVEGLLLTMATKHTIHAQGIIEDIQALYGDLRIFDTIIYRSIRFPESAAARRSLLRFPPGQQHAQAYRDLAQEIDDDQTA